MKIGRWLGLGAVFFVVWLLFLAPATLISNIAAQAGLQLQGVTGNVWRGSAKSARLQLAQIRGQALVFDIGDLSWQLEPLSLLLLNGCAQVQAQLSAQQFKGRLCASATGNVTASDVRLNVPASFLRLMAPIEGSGQVMLAFDKLELSGTQVTALVGSGRIEKLNLLIGKDWHNFGNLNLTLGAAAAPATGYDFSLESDDKALRWFANAPSLGLGNSGLEMHLRARLLLSESYQLQWANGLAMLGYELQDGAYLIETRLP